MKSSHIDIIKSIISTVRYSDTDENCFEKISDIIVPILKDGDILDALYAQGVANWYRYDHALVALDNEE